MVHRSVHSSELAAEKHTQGASTQGKKKNGRTGKKRNREQEPSTTIWSTLNEPPAKDRRTPSHRDGKKVGMARSDTSDRVSARGGASADGTR